MSGDNKVFDAIFRKAVEWMADCPEGETRYVQKDVSGIYIALHIIRHRFFTMQSFKRYELMQHMDGKFSINNGKGEYVSCDDPMGAFDAFVKACINERGDD